MVLSAAIPRTRKIYLRTRTGTRGLEPASRPLSPPRPTPLVCIYFRTVQSGVGPVGMLGGVEGGRGNSGSRGFVRFERFVFYTIRFVFSWGYGGYRFQLGDNTDSYSVGDNTDFRVTMSANPSLFRARPCFVRKTEPRPRLTNGSSSESTDSPFRPAFGQARYGKGTDMRRRLYPLSG